METAIEAFGKGYEAMKGVTEDIASQSILQQAYAGQTPEEIKDPIKQAATLQSAAGMLQSKGLNSAAYKLQKQAGALGEATQKQEADQLKVKEAKLGYAGQLVQSASSKQDLITAISSAGVDEPVQMQLAAAINRFPDTPEGFVAAKNMLSNVSKNADDQIKAQKLALDAAYKQAQIADKEADNVRADRREARLISAIGSKDSPKLTGAEVARSQRGINATGNIASSLEALKQFSSTTTTGFLPELQSAKGMTQAVQAAGVRGLSGDKAIQMNTIFTGIGRSLAAVETGGLATGLAELSKKMEAGIYIKPGDSPKTVALKLADIRRITEESLTPAIDSGMLTPKQEDTAKKLLNRIETAVPYSTIDVIEATRKKGAKTIGEASSEIVKPKLKGTGTKEDPIKLD